MGPAVRWVDTKGLQWRNPWWWDYSQSEIHSDKRRRTASFKMDVEATASCSPVRHKRAGIKLWVRPISVLKNEAHLNMNINQKFISYLTNNALKSFERETLAGRIL